MRSRRDTYLGAAATTVAVAHLLGMSANIAYCARGWINFLGSALLAAGWLLQIGGSLLLAIGFVMGAVAFFGGRHAREPKLRRGALILAGGYGTILVGGALSLSSYYYRSPDPASLQNSMILQVAAYLPALAAALLAASAFSRPRAIPGTNAVARNWRLGWASIGFGVGFALLLVSRLVTDSPVRAWDVAYLAALAAAVVAAVGFFGAARAYRLPSPDPLPRREGVLAIAAMLFLLYRVVELAYLPDLASWLWRLGSVAFAVSALCAAIGFAVSRRSLQGRERQPLITGDY